MRFYIFTFILISLSAPCMALSIDLRPFMSSVKNQGSKNTCSAFAATGLMEFLLKRDLNQDVDLSENYAFWSGKNKAPESEYVRALYAKSDGLAGYLAVRGFMFGSMLEEDWPYDSGMISPPDRAYILRDKLQPIYIPRHQIAQFLLSEKTPVVMNIMFYFNLFNKAGDALRLPNKSEVDLCLKKSSNCGGHVVLLVGYDDSNERFLFRNSWGADWGLNGYGSLPRTWVEEHCESCYQLKSLQNLTPNERQFVQKTAMGVSGHLTE